MKKIPVFMWVVGLIGIIGGFFLLWPQFTRTAGEDSRIGLVEAQRFLGLIKQVQKLQSQGAEEAKVVETAAFKKGRRFHYTANWQLLGLPPVREGLAFNFRCAKDGVCRAMELKGDIETGNGIGCNVTTGKYQCYGTYQPVTTKGFGGSEIVVGCNKA